VDDGSSILPQNQQEEDGAGHTSRSSGLLQREVSLARVSQSDLMTGGGVTAGGTRGIITEIA
jgi:hypothetical protein